MNDSRAASSARIDAERIVVAAVVVAWGLGLAFVLAHRIFVTNDSLNNYAHVWYVSDRLWHGQLPLRMPVLGHGDAFAFPYGAIPWFSAALLRPLFGDWVVTLWLALGWLGTAAGCFWAFPELRRRLWPAAVLLNPMLVEAVLLGQLPFLWSAALLFAAIACWRRGRIAWATVLCGLSQATHPPVMLPIVGLLILLELWRDREQRVRLLGAYAVSLVIAAPAAVIVLLSPSVEDTSFATQLTNLAGTDALRFVVIAWPLALVWLAGRVEAQPSRLALLPGLLIAALLLANVAVIPVRNDQYGWGALTRTPAETLVAFTKSPEFAPGATYRILRVADGKVGMYQLIRAGARLDSEFFPESIVRRSWPSTAEYAAFLQRRKVERVIVYKAYDARYQTNEHELLETLRNASAQVDDAALCTDLQAYNETEGYAVYRVQRGQCPVSGTQPRRLD